MNNEDFQKKLTKRLKELRIDNKLSQDDVAKVLKVARNVYNRYERGVRRIDNEDIVKLADFYKVSTDYIYGRED